VLSGLSIVGILSWMEKVVLYGVVGICILLVAMFCLRGVAIRATEAKTDSSMLSVLLMSSSPVSCGVS